MDDREFDSDSKNEDEEHQEDEFAQDDGAQLAETLTSSTSQVEEEDEEDEEEEEGSFHKTQHVSSISSGKDLLLGYVNERMTRANPRLRASLTGLIRIDVTDSKPSNSMETFMYDGTKEMAKLSQQFSENFGCSIRLSETNLLRVARGELNPQVAMLSGKIQVKGELGLAVYFFNLVAPRMRPV